MNRRAFVTGLGAVLAAPLATRAQQAGKLPKVGLLTISSGNTPIDMAFADALRDLGWIDGRNVVIEGRYLEGRSERFPEAAADLVRLQPVVIVAWGPPGVSAAKAASGTIPIVGITMGDPVAQGWVTSVARPGGQLTGIASYAPELGAKRVELLRQALGTLTRVAVLTNPTNVGTVQADREIELTARTVPAQFRWFKVQGAADLEVAFMQISQWQASAILVQPDTLFWAKRAEIVRLAAQSRLPAIYSLRDFADVGGLMTYGPSLINMAQRAAAYVDKILKGVKAADLPIEGPMRFELVINLKTAKALGLTIPQSLLLRADQLIE
jgi:putative tryptophan/tyrosine transport system substrate-binding protein